MLPLCVVFVLLENFDLNIKSIDTGNDLFGILLAVAAVVAFLSAVLWSGWRVHKIDDTMRSVMIETAKTTSMVFIILLGAAMLTAAFRAFGGEELVKGFLESLPGGFWTQFIVVMAVIFVLGFFLDFIEIARCGGSDRRTDPAAGSVRKYHCGLAWRHDRRQHADIVPDPTLRVRALLFARRWRQPLSKPRPCTRAWQPLSGSSFWGLAIVGNFPSLVNFLPNQSFLSAEAAPPPKNPRLQQCIEERLFPIYDERRPELVAAIDSGKTLDFSYLPPKRLKEINDSFTKALATFQLVEDIRESERDLADYVPEYRPLHISVRRMQADIRDHIAEIKEHREELRQDKRNGEFTSTETADMEDLILKLQAEQKVLEAGLPTEWGRCTQTLYDAFERCEESTPDLSAKCRPGL